VTKTINNTAYYVVKVDGVIVCVTENDSVACDYLVDYPGRVSVDPVEQGKFYGEHWAVVLHLLEDQVQLLVSVIA
jgi:hypothetical protein